MKLHLPAIAENLSIIESSLNHNLVIIPGHTEFPLADFLSIDLNKLRSMSSITQTRVLFEEGSPFVAGSVKKEEGAAASSFLRIDLATFGEFVNSDTGISYGGHDIHNDLMVILDENGLQKNIFGDTDKSFAEESINDISNRYGEVIYEYYNANNINAKSWADLTSSQKKVVMNQLMQCLDKASSPDANGMCSTKDPKIMSKEGCGYKNKDRWALYNRAGKIAEAIHNSLVVSQGYITHSYYLNRAKGRINMDGKKILSGMKFKSNKKNTGTPCRPESNFSSNTIPITRDI
jgi:hypothetical protein